MRLETADILAKLTRNRERLARCGVARIGLFGSGARGEARPDSDLDFLVELRPKTFDTYMDTKFLLEDLFGRPVDLVLPNTLKPALRARILAETIYASGFEKLS